MALAGSGWIRPGGPVERQLAAEIMARPTRRVADQHIRDATALGARKPGRDESVARIELRLYPQRTPRKKYAHRRDAGAPQSLQLRERLALVVERKLQVAARLGVRLLAVDDDGDIGTIRTAEVPVVDHSPAARFDGLLDRGAYRLRAGKIRVAGVAPLPGYGPAATLHRNTVGARAGHQHASRRADRQRAAVLEKNQ